MTQDPSSLEASLRELQPSALDEELLARLEASTDGTLMEPTPAEIRLESELRKNSPSPLTQDFLAELESIFQGVPFPSEENIVLFPKSPPTLPTPRKRPMWATAAAVGLIGALAAFMVPTTRKAPATASHLPDSPQTSPPAAASRNFVPASFDSGLSEVHDEGVIWKSNHEPHSLVRVVYKDKITLTDSNGRTVLVEQPRVEYMLVPAKTD
jgi:hypothetical protein